MPHHHQTTRCIESTTFEGVTFYLKKMTEGRRLALRKQLGDYNKRIREIFREQAQIEEQSPEIRDTARWLDLQDELDGLMVEKVNPLWVQWGVQSVQGLEADGKPLGISEWQDWPSALFDEILAAVKNEAELNGSERKNSESLTISGEQTDGNPNLLSAEFVSEKDSGKIVTAQSTSQVK